MNDRVKINNVPIASQNDELIEADVRFAATEMVECTKCGKPNPPNRLSCFYCVAVLPVNFDGNSEIKLNLRKLEAWESGHNVLVRSNSCNIDRKAAEKLGKMAGLDFEVVEKIASCGILLPLVRLGSEHDAETFAKAVEAAGLLSLTVADTDLRLNEPPVRLRHITFEQDKAVFTTFNQQEKIEIMYDEMILCVCGHINETRTESSNKLKKGKTEVIDEAAVSSDKKLIDIHTAAEPRGYRITTAGFDFSALGEHKSMIAGENLDILTEMLADKSRYLRIDGDYHKVRHLLDEVWEPEHSEQTYGFQISGLGKRSVSRVAVSTNELQFLKYSRSRVS